MGLGPPVCMRCRVVGELTPEDHPNYGKRVSWGASYWQCPICGDPDLQANLFTCKIPEDELEANRRFLEFMRGPSDSK
jgi:hypothetical protein